MKIRIVPYVQNDVGITSIESSILVIRPLSHLQVLNVKKYKYTIPNELTQFIGFVQQTFSRRYMAIRHACVLNNTPINKAVY